jgi:PAS domain S-box-containing protein
MTPEDLKRLRECCRDADAFERMQQILLRAETQQRRKRQLHPRLSFSPKISLGQLPIQKTLSVCSSLPPQALSNSNSENSSPENLNSEDLTPEQSEALEKSATRLRQEIDDRQWAEQALLESERRFRSLIENASDVIVVLDATGRFRYCSPSAKRILGYELADVFGRSAAEFVHPSDVALIMQVLQAAIAQPKVSQPPVKYWVRCKNDSWCIFEAVTTSYLDDPTLRGVVINCHDITERKQAQRAVQSANRRSFNILESITDAFIALDVAGHFTYINGQAAQLFRRSPTELLRQSIWQALPEVADSVLLQRVDRSFKDQIAGSFEEFYPALDRWFQVRIFPAADGLSIFFIDVTERQRSEAALRQQAEREQLISTVAQRIRQSLNLEEILNTTVSEVRHLLNADRVMLCQYRWHQAASPEAASLQEIHIIAESLQPDNDSLLEMVVPLPSWYEDLQADYRQGKSLVIHDSRQETQWPQMTEFLESHQVSAAIAVPILCGNQIWGTLVTNQCSAPRQWESWEVGLQEQLATQLAIALQQSELYRQVQQLNTQLEAQVQERTTQLRQALQFESTLKRITDSVRDSLDEDQILQTIVQELGTVLDVEVCDVALHDLENQTSTVCYEYNRSDLPSVKTAIPMGLKPNIYRAMFQSQDVQVCLLNDEVRSTDKHYSTLTCLMQSQQGMSGDLWLYKLADQSFTEGEIRLVQQVANQGAIAIRQARLYQAAQAQVAALETLNQLKSDFLSTVSHELRTPISNMKIAIYMLRTVKNPERQERYLSILQSECVREVELINDLLDLQRLEASAYPVLLETIPLRQFLWDLVEPFQSRARDRQQQLSLRLPEALPDLITDQAGLMRILSELLNNACKYTSPQGEIILEVQPIADSEAEIGGGTIAFCLRNQAEIPAIELPRIFEKFYRVPAIDRWKQGGTGLGLALVQQLVWQLGGTIEPHSSHGWTTFTVQLPRSPAA